MTDVRPRPPPAKLWRRRRHTAACAPEPLVSYWKLGRPRALHKWDGRSRRAEFWCTRWPTSSSASWLNLLQAAASIFVVLVVIYGLAVLLPARRRHPQVARHGLRAAGGCLIGLIPLSGILVLRRVLRHRRPAGANKYGRREVRRTPRSAAT